MILTVHTQNTSFLHERVVEAGKPYSSGVIQKKLYAEKQKGDAVNCNPCCCCNWIQQLIARSVVKIHKKGERYMT